MEKIEETKETIQPNQTIYIRNLNEKIKLPDLKKQLYALFSKFGQILDIVAKPNVKMRGQAFVVFKDVTAAALAFKQMDGFELLSKKMVRIKVHIKSYSKNINFAKSKSDEIAKLDGTYIDQKKKRELEQQKEKKRTRETTEGEDEVLKEKKKKKKKVGPVPIIPNNILFIENLPSQIYEDSKILDIVFKNFAGFKEIRLVPGNKGIGFAEYEAEHQATTALNSLQGFKIYDNILKITYAKK